MKILIIEDKIRTARAIHRGLQAEGYVATIARAGPEGLGRLRSETFDVVLLDWMLPGCDGIEILHALRKEGPKPPVLLLTAKDAVEDRVMGLDSGADDCLVKPFAFAELLARLRRSGNEESLPLSSSPRRAFPIAFGQSIRPPPCLPKDFHPPKEHAAPSPDRPL